MEGNFQAPPNTDNRKSVHLTDRNACKICDTICILQILQPQNNKPTDFEETLKRLWRDHYFTKSTYESGTKQLASRLIDLDYRKN